MASRPSQPVETPDDKSISAMQYLIARLQPRSIFPCSREFVEEQMFLGHAMRKQGIHLQVQFLVIRTDPCVPNQAAILSADHRRLLGKKGTPAVDQRRNGVESQVHFSSMIRNHHLVVFSIQLRPPSKGGFLACFTRDEFLTQTRPFAESADCRARFWDDTG